MNIMVFWSSGGINQGAVDHFTSPYIADTVDNQEHWQQYRITFNQIDEEGEIRRFGCTVTNLAEGYDPLTFAVTDRCKDFTEYVNWLEENIDLIQIDGVNFWYSNRFDEDETP